MVRRIVGLGGVIFLALSACALAPSQPQRTPGVQGEQEKATQPALQAIAAELRAMRQEVLRLEQERADRDSRPAPPIYSNWVLILVTAGAASVALCTLAAIRKQVVIGIAAAQAARKSADVAEQTLRLAHRPYLDVKRLTVGEAVRAGGTDPPYLVVSYAVYNASPNPAALAEVEAKYWIDNPRDAVVRTHVVTVTISPERGYPFPIVVDLDTNQDRSYKAGRLMIHVAYTVTFRDPFGTEHKQKIDRVVLCGPRFANSYLSDLTLTEEGADGAKGSGDEPVAVR